MTSSPAWINNPIHHLHPKKDNCFPVPLLLYGYTDGVNTLLHEDSGSGIVCLTTACSLSHDVSFIYTKLFSGFTKSCLQCLLQFPEEQEAQRKLFQGDALWYSFSSGRLGFPSPLRQPCILRKPQKWKIVSYSNLETSTPKKQD